jgi:asparagine synthase (glutamine-hydrolysing)
MSAVFGVVNKNGRFVNPDSLHVMQSAIAHRATDGKGVWVDGVVGFGHCLLKVYPQQDYEHCPLIAYNCTITADARLDNRNELAALLGIDKTRLIMVSDSEIILLSYKRWGEDCVNHLEGEFAFAIWDGDNQKLFAATDHIGFRPLFYYDSPEQFIFCSEIKGIVAVKPLPNYFNEESLVQYFYSKGKSNITYNKEIFALCGGSVLTLQDGKMAYRKYWNLESTGKYNFTKDQDWYDCTREMLYRAVENRLNTDVPIGVTLSGGLDSTSVACILSELLMKKNKPLYTFSSVLPLDHRGIEKDERYYIDLVGKHCPNIIQTYVEAPGVGPLSNLDAAFEIDESFPVSVAYMNYALHSAAMQNQVRILFNGFGGDFWISWKGHSVVYDLVKKGKYRQGLKIMQQFCAKESESFHKIFRRMYLSQTPYYSFLRSLFKKQNEMEQKMLNDDILKRYHSQIAEKAKTSHADSLVAEVNQGVIGRKVSKFYNRSNFYKMDTGTPLFDKKLYELLIDLPIHCHANNGAKRGLIRTIMDGVIPEEIRQRTDKKAFSPDSAVRLIAQKQEVLNVVNHSNDDLLLDSFLNRSLLKESLCNVRSYEGFPPSFDMNFLFSAKTGISATVLLRLKEKGYIFDLNK